MCLYRILIFTWCNRWGWGWWRAGQQHQLLQQLPVSSGLRRSGLQESPLQLWCVCECWPSRSTLLRAALWPDPEPGVCFGAVAPVAAHGSGTRCSSCCRSEDSGCCSSVWLFDLLSPLQMDWTWHLHLISLQKADILNLLQINFLCMTLSISPGTKLNSLKLVTKLNSFDLK